VLKDFQPHIVHAQFGTMTAFFCALFSQIWHRKFVITFRGSDLNPAPSMSPIRLALGHGLSHFASFFSHLNICVSSEVATRLCIYARRKVQVLPNGVNLDEFRPLPVCDARNIMNWDLDPPIIMFNAGRSPEVKRFDLAQQVVAILQKEFCSLKFVVLKGEVPAEKVRTMLYGSTMLLVTSDYEGSPNIVKEALVCGLPVVSVNVGDVRLQIDGVTPGAIVERNVGELVRAARDVILSNKRSNGFNLRAASLDDKVIARRLVGFYRSLDKSA
jgi:glycosyltransferase involved in cell wall biosynthesis